MAQPAVAAGKVVKLKQVVLAAYPHGMVKETDFRVEETQIDLAIVQPGSNDVAVKLLYISLDPYYRELMSEEDVLGFGTYHIGQVRFFQCTSSLHLKCLILSFSACSSTIVCATSFLN